MQNNKSKGFRSFVREKGYYIVLLLCAAAVGTSAYFLLTRNRSAGDKIVAAVIATEPTQNQKPPVTEPTGKASGQEASVTKPAETEEPDSAPEKLTVMRPLDGETVSAFAADHLAYNETTRDWRTHEGVDLRAEEGQEVFAVADGTVYAIYEDESYGMTVVLQHADGYTTQYSNLNEEIPVSVGQKISQGDVLGNVGATACVETASEPHLHFAVYRNHAPVDPEEFLKANTD